MNRRQRRNAAVRAWRSYSGSPLVTRAFLLARLLILPLGGLDGELLALRGRVLSLGSGHGLLERYLAEINPAVVVNGVELDQKRVRVASDTAGRTPRVSLRAGDARSLPARDEFDAALAVDFLHHIDPSGQLEVLESLARALTPGGILLVKDIALTPRWRWAVNRLHDRVVAGPEPIHCRDPEDMATMIASAGFEVEALRRLSHFAPYPHYLVRARLR